MSASFEKQRGPEVEAMPPELMFRDCLAKEKKLTKASVADLIREECKKTLFVTHPVFIKTNILPSLASLNEKRYPLDFSIVKNPQSRTSESEWRYIKILEHMSQFKSKDDRLLFLARWLKQEGVCEPEDILPPDVLQRALRAMATGEKLSKTNLYQRALVRIWLPYFEQLLSVQNDYQPDDLIKQGYCESAVGAAVGKRSAVRATTEWFQNTERVRDARTVENAYSKTRSAGRRRLKGSNKSHNFLTSKSVK